VPAFLKRLREEPVMDALAKASDQTGDAIELTNKDIRLIRETVGGRQTELAGVEPALRAELQQARVRETMAGTPIAGADENTVSLTVSRRTLNNIIDRVVGKFASQEGTGLTLGQLQTISKATEATKGTLPSVQKFNAALTRVRLSEAFTPVATRPTGFIKLWSDNVLPLLDTYDIRNIRKAVLSPEEAYAKNIIVSALAGIPDGYKIDYDRFLSQAKSQGLTGEAAHDFAYAETIAKPFQEDGVQNLFSNFFAAYYGGYDSVVELEVLRSGANVNALKGNQNLISIFVEAEFKARKPAVPNEPVIVQIARLFNEQQDNVGRLKVLTLAAKLMEGRAISSFVDSPVWSKDIRIKIEQVKNMRPEFSQANIKVPMFAAYLQQERANRVLQAASNIRATDAITKKATFSTAILNGGEALARNIETTIKELYDVADEEFFSALMEASQGAVRAGAVDHLSTRNFPLTTPNTKYPKIFYTEVLDLLKAGLSNGSITQRTIPSGITDDMAKITLAENIYRSLGFQLQIDKADPAKALQTLADRGGRLIKDSSPNVSDDVVNLVLGSYSPMLTNDQMRSWVYALDQSNKAFAATAKIKRGKAASVAAETALNGLYGVDEMKAVVKSSSSLRAVEEAFTAFDWLRDNRLYDALTPEQKVIIAEKLANDTANFTQKLTDAIDTISVKELPREQIKTLLAQTGYAGSTFLFETLPSFVKQSILAGAIIPNFINQFQNYLTASLMMTVTSSRDPGKRFILEFLSNYNIFSRRTIKTPTGKVYTYKDIEELSSNLGLGASSAQRAEISKNLLRDLINYAGTMGTGGPLGTFERRKGFFRNILSSFGLGDFSVWSQFSNNIDLAFRRKVVARALEEGRTEAEAVAEARKALFDYNDLTEVERNSIAKYIWFYRFMRQNLVQTTVAFLDNPAKIARLAKLSKVQASKMFDMASGGNGELHPDLAQYKESKAFVALIDGMDKERLAIYTPSLPILEATSQLINGAAFIGLIGTNIDAIAGLAEPMDPLSRDKIIEKFLDDYSLAGPAVEAVKIGIARTLGIQITGFDKEPIIYLDPRFVAMSKAMGNWDTIMAHFEIEMDARDPRAGITTFDGYYYRLGKSPENKTRWQMFMNLVQTAGVSRTIRDYAIILPYLQAVPGMEAGTEISTGDPLLDAVKFLGVFSVGAQPTPEAAQQNIRRELIKSLEERSK
jgi:hypothetical protein